MPSAWEKMDLKGGGLQSLQIRLQKLQKRKTTAYFCWCLFPIGLHRFYLHRKFAWLYPAGTALAGLAAATGSLAFTAATAAPSLVAALADLPRLQAWISEYNRIQRQKAWFSQKTPPAPRHGQEWTGNLEGENRWEADLRQYSEIKETEHAGHPAGRSLPEKKGVGRGQRMLSFAEQERLLAEITRDPRKTEGTGKPPEASA